MILRNSVIVPVLVLFILFTAMFVSLISVYEMPQKMMGSKGAYVLTSSNDNNPIRSNMDIRIAYGLENMSYITAVSPEIFVFTTLDGKAITVRGVDFKAFMNLEEAALVEGRMAEGPMEAMVGYRMARALHLSPGENITLYGSFKPAVAVVNITGVFRANDPSDDELLVSLPTARALAGIAPGKVSVIRVRTSDVAKVKKLMSPTYPKFTVSANLTHQIYVGDTDKVNITVRNMGSTGGEATLNITIGNRTWTREIFVEHEKNLHINFTAPRAGKYNLTAVVKNDVFYYTCYTEISVVLKPATIVGSTFAYTGTPEKFVVESVNGTVVRDGNITVVGPNGYIKKYDVNGTLSIVFPEPGKYAIEYSSRTHSPANLTVQAYEIRPFFSLASISPEPINGTLYATAGSRINITTPGTVDYSINGGPRINSSIIAVPEALGNYTVNISVRYGNYMGNTTLILHPVPAGSIEIISPVKNGDQVKYLEKLNFTVRDTVPIKTIRYDINNVPHTIDVGQNFSRLLNNYTYSFNITVRELQFRIKITAVDAWNRQANMAAECPVLLDRDIIKPEIQVPAEVTLWSGNRTEVNATDNVAISFLSVHVFGRYFNTSSEHVWIPTAFYNNTTVSFIPPGRYRAEVMAMDTSGNKNFTNFTIIINNTGERVPPVILGPSFANLTNGIVTFRAFDNVGVKNISCYNGTELIKSVNGSALTLTSDEFSDGIFQLRIVAVDDNGNYGYKHLSVIKNYTDREKPVIYLTKSEIWGGNDTWVVAVDNTEVQNITVRAFGEVHRGKSMVRIRTLLYENHTLRYIPPGNYTISVVAVDIFNNTAYANLTLHINNTGERIPPIFPGPSLVHVDATQNVSLESLDNSGVAKMWAVFKGNMLAESNSSWLNFSAKLLPCDYNHITVFAVDINGNMATENITVDVHDNIPPEIMNTTVKIWGGNTTVITGRDNVRVSYMEISIFGKVFTSHNGTVWIPTEYREKDTVKFIPSGRYTGTAKIEDSSGNINNSRITIIIDNTGEKLPPVLVGPSIGAINESTSVNYIAYDNVGVRKIWIDWNGKTIASSSGNRVSLRYGTLPAGKFNLQVYAEDLNGNIAWMNTTVVVKGIKRVEISPSLSDGNITVNERATVEIELSNQDVRAEYHINVYIDKTLYYEVTGNLSPYEKKVLYIVLPYMKEGKHHITVNNESLILNVEPNPASKLPTDLVLKYAHNIKFTESRNVIYKGFRISEGNFILVLAALIIITLILVFLGMYSTTMKGLNNSNIGILRAIGASNRQIFVMFLKESVIYFLIPGLLGIVGGYLLVIFINSMDLLTAFGHHLTIAPTWSDISIVLGVSITFIFTSLFIIYWRLMHMHVSGIMGKSAHGRITTLDELLQENS